MAMLVCPQLEEVNHNELADYQSQRSDDSMELRLAVPQWKAHGPAKANSLPVGTPLD